MSLVISIPVSLILAPKTDIFAMKKIDPAHLLAHNLSLARCGSLKFALYFPLRGMPVFSAMPLLFSNFLLYFFVGNRKLNAVSSEF